MMPNTTIQILLCAGLATLVAGPVVASQEFTLSVAETGKRDYYCTFTLKLASRSDASLDDVNGYLLSSVNGLEVGRSKGASFGAVASGAAATAVFETPDAPCNDIDTHVFVVGSCIAEGRFIDVDTCADAIEPTIPMEAVRSR